MVLTLIAVWLHYDAYNLLSQNRQSVPVRKTFLISVLAASAIAFQACDLARMVYAKFGLSLSCPVVGQAVWGDCAPSAVDPSALSGADSQAPSTGHHCCSSTKPPANQQPSPDHENRSCQTCTMLAVASTFASLPVPTVDVGVLLPMPSEQMAFFMVVQKMNANTSIQGRAPPNPISVL